MAQTVEQHVGPVVSTVFREDSQELSRLLVNGANANELTPEGDSALLVAVLEGNLDAVAILLQHGAQANLPNLRGGLRPLHVAAMRGHLSIVRTLLTHGATVNATAGDSAVTALAFAARAGHTAVVHRLLEHGANPNVPINQPSDPEDLHGLSLLILACSLGDADMVHRLIATGANVNRPKADGITPLMAAAFNGELACAQLLIDAGADVNLVNDSDPQDKYTALDIAQANGHHQFESILASMGAVPALYCGK